MPEERWSKPISQKEAGFTNMKFCMATKQISFVQPIGKTDANGNVLKNARGYVQEWLWTFDLSKPFDEAEIREKLHGFDRNDINRFIQLVKNVYAVKIPETPETSNIMSFDEFIHQVARTFHPAQDIYDVSGDLLKGYRPKDDDENFSVFDLMANHNTKKKIQVVIDAETIIEDKKSCFLRRVFQGTPESFIECYSDKTVEVSGELSFYEGKASLSLKAKKVKVLDKSLRLREEDIAREQYKTYFKKEEKQKEYPLESVQKIAVITGGSTKKPCRGAGDFKKNIREFLRPHIDEYYVNSNKIKNVVDALDRIKNSPKKYNAICIIRGGGDIEELCQYSSPELLEAIHRSEIPIITGIGHVYDDLLCDHLADYNAGTPTAVADYLNLQFYRIRKETQKHKTARKKEEQQAALEDAKTTISYQETEIKNLRNENARLRAEIELLKTQPKQGFFRRLFHL